MGPVKIKNTSNILNLQREYIKFIEKEQKKPYGIMGRQALESMRDSGYKTSANAIFDLIDNSIESAAQNVFIALGFGSKDRQKNYSHIAIIDDGDGMEPEMIRAAVSWGGSHRHFSLPEKIRGQDNTIGRFGYGLPSACVNMTRTYKVFSKVEGEDWYSVQFNMDDPEIYETFEIPEPMREDPPNWCLDVATGNFFESGTIVLLQNVDKMTRGFQSVQGFRDRLTQELGIHFRNFLLNKFKIYIQTENPKFSQSKKNSNGDEGLLKIKPIDPLFITPGCLYFEKDKERDPSNKHWVDAGKSVMAERITEKTWDIELDGKVGKVSAKVSYLPSGSWMSERKRQSKRFLIRKQYNGLIINREGRQIDVVETPKNNKFSIDFRNYARTVGCEINFDSTLDEFFGITVHKQQVEMDERIWNKLNDVDFSLAKIINSKISQHSKVQKGKVSAEKKKKSEKGTREVEKSIASNILNDNQQNENRNLYLDRKTKKRYEENLSDTINDMKLNGDKRTTTQIKKELTDNNFKFLYHSLKEAPFYTTKLVFDGKSETQTHVVTLNKDHVFFTDVLYGNESNDFTREMFEMFIGALAITENQCFTNMEETYTEERNKWSARFTSLMRDYYGRNYKPEREE